MYRNLIVLIIINIILVSSCTLFDDSNKALSTPITANNVSLTELGQKLKCNNPSADLSAYEKRCNEDAIRENCVEGHAGVVWLRLWKAFMAGDLQTVLGMIAEDAELTFYGPGADVIPFFQTFYGPEGLIQHLQLTMQYVTSVQRTVTGMVSDAKQVFFTYDYIKTFKNGKSAMLKGAFFVTVSHGKVQKWKFYCSDTYTLAKAMEDMVNSNSVPIITNAGHDEKRAHCEKQTTDVFKKHRMGEAGVVWEKVWNALMAGDLPTILGYIADDAELIFYGPGPDIIPFLQTFHGPSGLIQHLQLTAKYVKSIQRFPTGMISDDRQVFFSYDYIKTLKNDKVITLHGAFFVDVRHGKIQKWQYYCADTYTLANAMKDLL
jgi:ketosteroid isomerase-like protein